MSGNNDRDQHSSVTRSYEIDQRAIKLFLDWLPDNWLPRKQDPDFFVDYLIELTENGEPSGLHFGAQIKGHQDNESAGRQLSYQFKTKHLKYYLRRSKNPVFLFLINTITREGFWVFAQKYLKEKISDRALDEQQSITIHFSPEDSILNSTKFKCSLPAAEKFVRELHPGSIHAALQKRRQELESKDPRCSVSISVKDGKEQITINPKETFSFETKIRSKNVEGWRKFIECGTEVKVEPHEIEIRGAPILEEMSKAGGHWKMQFGSQLPASIQIILENGAKPTFIQANGHVRAGTKFMSFKCDLAESALEIHGQIPFDVKDESAATVNFSFSLDK